MSYACIHFCRSVPQATFRENLCAVSAEYYRTKAFVFDMSQRLKQQSERLSATCCAAKYRYISARSKLKEHFLRPFLRPQNVHLTTFFPIRFVLTECASLSKTHSGTFSTLADKLKCPTRLALVIELFQKTQQFNSHFYGPWLM